MQFADVGYVSLTHGWNLFMLVRESLTHDGWNLSTLVMEPLIYRMKFARYRLWSYW